MSFPDYNTSDTLDGTFDPVLMHEQIESDPAITTPFDGINTTGTDFTLAFDSTPTVQEQAQCDAIVAAHSSLVGVQNSLVVQIKMKRDDDRLKYEIVAEYPPGSGNFFSCSLTSQDNWSKLGTMDSRGLVTYPFSVTTNDERGSYNVVDSADLTNIIGTISTSVLAERSLAQTYITNVLAATDVASAQQAADPYLNM